MKLIKKQIKSFFDFQNVHNKNNGFFLIFSLKITK